MRLYRCNCYNSQEGIRVSWHTSERAARQCLREFQAERKAAGDECQGPEGVHAYEVAPTLAGFVAFLNEHFTTDNG